MKNVVLRKSNDAAEQSRRDLLVRRLDSYESSFDDQIEKGASEGSAHYSALMIAGLTPSGLLHARVYAGKYPTERPGIVAEYRGAVRGIYGRVVERECREQFDPASAALTKAEAK